MHRFFVKQKWMAGRTATIRGQEARHMVHVLRLRIGDLVELVDDGGAVYKATIEKIDGESITLSVGEPRHSHRESPVRITLAQAYLKDRKMDRLIRQLTELGITRWIPFPTERSVSRPDHRRLSNRVARWKKISREALKQSRRNHPPSIQPFPSYAAILDEAKTSEVRVVFCEKARQPLAPSRAPSGVVTSVFVLVGPEGGFTAREIVAAISRSFSSVSLGPRILRAETAAMAAIALIQYLYGDLGI